jgi:uncharacterized protein YjiS (DUF1127 family)
MSTQILPTPEVFAENPSANSASTYDSAKRSEDNLFQRAYRATHRYVAEKQRRYALEREIDQAIEHLHRLTDDQLRDMGITRMDIEHAVRHGKD